jgi:hypothetical protein
VDSGPTDRRGETSAVTRSGLRHQIIDIVGAILWETTSLCGIE